MQGMEVILDFGSLLLEAALFDTPVAVKFFGFSRMLDSRDIIFFS